MPCYEIRTVSIDLKMLDKNLLIEAIKDLGFAFQENEGRFFISSRRFEATMTLDLNTGKAKIAESDQNSLNQIKQKYSEKAIELVAKKRKWVLKKTGNRILAKKY